MAPDRYQKKKKKKAGPPNALGVKRVAIEVILAAVVNSEMTMKSPFTAFGTCTVAP